MSFDASRLVESNKTEISMIKFFWSKFKNLFSSIVFDRNTNRPKGFGFCEFQDQQGAENAVTKMNGVEMNGRPLRVNWANK